MARRWELWAISIALLGVPLWSAASQGLIELRACAPTDLFAAHVAILRPDAACYSGVGYDPGALALVGTVAVATLVAWLTGAGVLAWIGAFVARCGHRLAALLRIRRPILALPRLPIAGTALRAATIVVPPARRPHWVSLAVVGWRGPPQPA